MLICADVVRCVALVTIPAAAWWEALSLPLLYVVAAVTGVATVLFELADHVFITDLAGRERLLAANGKREAVDAVAEITGPALGGSLVAWLTAPIAIAVDAVTFVASALLIARIRKREQIVAAPAGTSLLADVRTGIHVAWRDPAIRALFVAAATMTLFGSFMAALYTLLALKTLGLTPTELGITIGCGGIGALAGAAFSRRAAIRPRLASILHHDAGRRRRRADRLPRQRDDAAATAAAARGAWPRGGDVSGGANGTLTPTGGLIGGALAEGIGMRPTLWLLAIGDALAFLTLVLARGALPARA